MITSWKKQQEGTATYVARRDISHPISQHLYTFDQIKMVSSVQSIQQKKILSQSHSSTELMLQGKRLINDLEKACDTL